MGKPLGAWIPVTPRGRDPAGAGSGHALARDGWRLSFRRCVQIGRNAELCTQRSFVVAGSQVAEPTRQRPIRPQLQQSQAELRLAPQLDRVHAQTFRTSKSMATEDHEQRFAPIAPKVSSGSERIREPKPKYKPGHLDRASILWGPARARSRPPNLLRKAFYIIRNDDLRCVGPTYALQVF